MGQKVFPSFSLMPTGWWETRSHYIVNSVKLDSSASTFFSWYSIIAHIIFLFSEGEQLKKANSGSTRNTYAEAKIRTCKKSCIANKTELRNICKTKRNWNFVLSQMSSKIKSKSREARWTSTHIWFHIRLHFRQKLTSTSGAPDR